MKTKIIVLVIAIIVCSALATVALYFGPREEIRACDYDYVKYVCKNYPSINKEVQEIMKSNRKINNQQFHHIYEEVSYASKSELLTDTITK